MIEQRSLFLQPYPGYSVQDRSGQVLPSQLAVIGNCPAVNFIPNAHEKMEDRVILAQRDRVLSSWNENLVGLLVLIGLCNSDQVRGIAGMEPIDDFLDRREMAFSP